MLRRVLITREPDGTVWALHSDGTRVEFPDPQTLWNFVTLDVSQDRKVFARPPRRTAAEERRAVEQWLAQQRKALEPDALLRRVGQALNPTERTQK